MLRLLSAHTGKQALPPSPPEDVPPFACFTPKRHLLIYDKLRLTLRLGFCLGICCCWQVATRHFRSVYQYVPLTDDRWHFIADVQGRWWAIALVARRDGCRITVESVCSAFEQKWHRYFADRGRWCTATQ